MKRILTLLLLISILLCSVSCTNSSKIVNENKSESTSVLTETEAETTKLIANVPDSDFDEYSFKFLNLDQVLVFWATQTLDINEMDGDILHDAIYIRNNNIEESYNIVISEIGDANPGDTIMKSVNAGDNEYDAVFLHATNVSIAGGGFMLEFGSIPYINLEKPWWSQSANYNLSIANKLYFAAGDIGLSYFDSVMPLAMNKQMIEDYNLDDPYKLVADGKWTLDVMKDMLKVTAADLNGDGKCTLDDQFGMLGMSEEYIALTVAAGQNIIQKDVNDIPYLAITNERFIQAFEKAIGALNQKDVFANIRIPKFKCEGDLTLFTSGRSLFFSDVLFWISNMRDMEQDFAILPRFKYDEAQENYYTYIHESGTVMGIPKTASNIERTGIIIEALAAESYYTVIPVYYDTVLSQKYARDKESIEMLNLIFANRVFDLGSIYNWGSAYGALKTLGEKGDANVASLYAKIESNVSADIKKLLKAYEDN